MVIWQIGQLKHCFKARLEFRVYGLGKNMGIGI
jgi:hypothetical protein